MSAEAFYVAMLCLANDDDLGTEDRHQLADKLMMDALKLLGYNKGIEIFQKMKKWYA